MDCYLCQISITDGVIINGKSICRQCSDKLNKLTTIATEMYKPNAIQPHHEVYMNEFCGMCGDDGITRSVRDATITTKYCYSCHRRSSDEVDYDR